MDVLIYVADGVLHDGIDYADRIEERLTKAGLTSARRDLTSMPTEQVRPELAYVLTGGQTSVHADEKWMRSAIGLTGRLVANADRDECSVVGICLGSQIIAEALRAHSITPSDAIEVGLTPVTPAVGDGFERVVPSFHYQSISPEIGTIPGVRIEWRNERTPVQAFSYGRRVFGCQFHPELTRADVHALIDYNQDVIARWRGDVAAAHRSVDRHTDALPDDLFDRMVIDRILDRRPDPTS
jgi:GMP synthase-like glutamine amidotransferase